MDRDEGSLRPRRLDDTAAFPQDLDLALEDSPRRRAAETHETPWLDDLQFGLPPRAARGDLTAVRFLMEPPFASWLPFEMLHRVSDVAFLAIQAGLGQRSIQQPASWSDEWTPFAILGIARLFAEQDNLCIAWPFTEDRLRRVLVKRACFTRARGSSQDVLA